MILPRTRVRFFARLASCHAGRRRITAAAAAVAAAALLAPAAPALAEAVPGADWGPQGTMLSDSAITINWDNKDNPADSVVPRDAGQLLAHTNGKTYADVNAKLRQEAESTFGQGNGLGGLAVTVSQTRNLQHQAVTVSFNGAKAVPGSNGKTSTYLQVFQCWGAMGPDGKPDPNASAPDPATCQFGATGPDGDISNPAHQRALLNDPLVRGGDWELAAPASPRMNLPAPFLAINGQTTRMTDGFNLSEYRNPFFSRTSTNEHSNFLSADTGSDKVAAGGSRTFEIQTGSEASGLGCGFRADAPSVSKCWLVAVPRTEVIDSILNASPLSPSLWATRIQVPLHFQDSAAVCPSDQAATLSFGSESLAAAMKSWIPGMCAQKKFTLGFTPMSDRQARSQLGAGQSLAFTTRPVTGKQGMVYAPAAISGVVVAMTIDNVCTRRFTQYTAADCGYADRAEFEADKASNGSLVRNLRLNARVLAKLLTQSYVLHTAPASAADAPFAQAGSTRYGRPMTYSLQQDPEFLTLNPKGLGAAANIAPPVVEGLRSDAAAAVWDWILNDKNARAFLEGCPDESGMVINPFYSTRTYTSCADSAAELDAATKQKIADTRKPASFTYVPPAYPSDSAPYPQQYWTEKPAVLLADGKTVDQPPLTVGDQYARVMDMAVAAQNTVRAQPASVTEWCADCSPPAFKSVPRQGFGSRSVISITDAASAAKFQLPTAQLCNTDGSACVAANNASLTAAAEAFEPTGTPGVLGPDKTPDYAANAYPLTVPVYGAVDSSAVTAGEATTYARLFDYVATSGQEQGFRSGMLPPGYAPLTPALWADTVSAAKALAKIGGRKPVSALVDVVPPLKATTLEKLLGPHIEAGTASGTEELPAAAVAEAKAVTPAAAVAAAPGMEPVAGGKTPRAANSWPQYLLIAGGCFAIASAVSSLLLARGKRR